MISIIIFAKNEEFHLKNTYDNTITALKNLNLTDYEIILIDDNSSDSTFKEMKLIATNYSKVIALQASNDKGISAAILTGFTHSKGEIIVPIPGHNMYSHSAIERVLGYASANTLVIGCRKNLFSTRPIVKFLSSQFLLFSYRIFVSGKFCDIHGLNSYPRVIVGQAQNYKLGHGFHMIPITLAIRSRIEIIQIGVYINKNHKKRAGRKMSKNFPTFKSIYSVISELFEAYQILKFNK